MSEKRFKEVYGGIWDTSDDGIYSCKDSAECEIDRLIVLLNNLAEENEQLRNLIKANVFREYREGSLTDLQFKAIAYDDIVNVEMDYDAEPKLIIYCKEGTKSDIERYARVKTFGLFIPLGVAYIIKEEE